MAEFEKEITSLRYAEETLLVAALDRGEDVRHKRATVVRVRISENNSARAA